MTRSGQFCDLPVVAPDDRDLDVAFAEKVLGLRTINREDEGWQEYDQADGFSFPLGRYSTDLDLVIESLRGTRWRYGEIQQFSLGYHWGVWKGTATASMVVGGLTQDIACSKAVRSSTIRSAAMAEALCRVAIEARERENTEVPRACRPMAAGQEVPIHGT